MLTLGTVLARVGTTFGERVADVARTAAAWPTRSSAANAVGTAALALLAVASFPLTDRLSALDREADGLAVALVVAAAVAALGRRSRPEVAALGAGAAVGTYLALGYPYGAVFGFVVLTVYGVARHRSPYRAGWVAAVVYLFVVALVLTNDAALDGFAGLIPALAWVAIPFTVGLARRSVTAARARERTTSDQRLVDAERLRISQEVHDVVGHGLAAIQMQADITLHLSDPRPEQTRAALRAISEASRSALDELRVTLAASARDAGGSAARTPTPGLAQAERLCRRVEESGVGVRFAVEGETVPLPTAADVAVYRVLQESLTNVLKHSPHPHADVRVVHDPAAVTVEVTNTDLAPERVEGVGITGMRRRVTQLGGSFRAGPGPRPGTFQVRATVPRSREDSR